ncbi:MAG TPA: hypothetical protein VFM75_06105, partial [Modicisalibacter sp.]|nr:hypothetical protein [Modicisalibacter sp.]
SGCGDCKSEFVDLVLHELFTSYSYEQWLEAVSGVPLLGQSYCASHCFGLSGESSQGQTYVLILYKAIH